MFFFKVKDTHYDNNMSHQCHLHDNNMSHQCHLQDNNMSNQCHLHDIMT